MPLSLAPRGSRKTNYPYAVARVQAKRAKLMPRSEYEKVLKMDVSEVTRFIEESAYREEVDELASRFSGLDLLEAALTLNQERTFASVRRVLDGEGGQLIRLWLSRYTVADLKTIMRGKQGGASREELLRELLLEDLDTYHLFAPLLADEVRTPEEIADALDAQGSEGTRWARVLRAVPADSPLPRYEDALDKAYFQNLLDGLKAFSQKGQKTATAFVKREIDARNLQNAARWVHSGGGGDFSQYVIPGGRRLSVRDVMDLAAASDLQGFDDALQSHEELYAAVREGLAHAIQEGRLAPFQAAVQGYLMKEVDRLSQAHPLTILPIMAYLVRKHQEVVTLRAVARGRAAGLSEARLRELLQV